VTLVQNRILQNRSAKAPIRIINVLLVSVLWLASTAVQSQEAHQPAITPEQVELLQQRLEDPAAREQLIQNLQLLVRTQDIAPEDPNRIKTAVSELLATLSERIAFLSKGIDQIVLGLEQLPMAWRWLSEQATDPEQLQIWQEIVLKIFVVVGLGYLIYATAYGFLRSVRQPLLDTPPSSFPTRLARLSAVLLIELLPLLLFTLTTYFCLAILTPREVVRLVTLSWIHAFILVHFISTVTRFFFSPNSQTLRLLSISGETANYLQVWTTRLSRLVIYGFFGLQVGSYLGLQRATYEILLHLIGLFFSAMLIIFIAQNRRNVAQKLESWGDLTQPESSAAAEPASVARTVEAQVNAGAPSEGTGQLRLRHFLGRLARAWYIIASCYVVVLYVIWSLEIPGGFLFVTRATLLTLLLLGIGMALIRLVQKVFDRGFSISDDLKQRFPGLENRVNNYIGYLRKALKGLVQVMMVLLILQTWNIDVLALLSSDSGKVLSGSALRIVFILISAYLVWEITTLIIHNKINSLVSEDGGFDAERARIKTLMNIVRKGLTIVLVILATLMIVSELGIEIGPLLAGAGVVGLAVGFGAQKLVQDVITGVFILIENQIAEGDVVSVGDKAGLVEAVSIRTVRLRDLSGVVHTIPYSTISTVSNLTKEFSCYVFDIGVAYREDADTVMTVIKEIGEELRADTEYGPKILEPIEVFGLDAFADSALVIKGRIKTAPIKQWWVGREFNRRLKLRFDELNIEIPFPHVTMYFGENKDGWAPPAHLKMVTEKT